MTVQDHLVFGSRCVGSPIEDALKRSARYGLDGWLDHEAKALSTGNCRKLWIIMCTLGSFDVVILDEPFNGLDEGGSDVLREEILAWRQDKAVLLIAHTPPAGIVRDTTVILAGRRQAA